VLPCDLTQQRVLTGPHRLRLRAEVAQVAFGRAGAEQRHQHEHGEEASVHQRTSDGTVVTCPPVMANSARRFCAHTDSPVPSTLGRSSPYGMVEIRVAAMPYPVRKSRTVSARR